LQLKRVESHVSARREPKQKTMMANELTWYEFSLLTDLRKHLITEYDIFALNLPSRTDSTADSHQMMPAPSVKFEPAYNDVHPQTALPLHVTPESRVKIPATASPSMCVVPWKEKTT
jgi:hypothetical protein